MSKTIDVWNTVHANFRDRGTGVTFVSATKVMPGEGGARYIGVAACSIEDAATLVGMSCGHFMLAPGTAEDDIKAVDAELAKREKAIKAEAKAAAKAADEAELASRAAKEKASEAQAAKAKADAAQVKANLVEAARERVRGGATPGSTEKDDPKSPVLEANKADEARVADEREKAAKVAKARASRRGAKAEG